jgi:hypothetical protein
MLRENEKGARRCGINGYQKQSPEEKYERASKITLYFQGDNGFVLQNLVLCLAASYSFFGISK